MSRPPLVGRGAELRRIEQILEGAAGGTSCGVFVLGQPGVGKSRLLAAGRELAAARGLRTVTACCLPLSVQLPLDPVLELLRALGESFERPPSGSTCELFALAIERLAHATREGPLLVCLDDLQWSDETTLEFVHYCLVRLRDLPLAWLLSSRPGRAGGTIAYRFERASGLTRLELGGFTPAEVRQLTERVLPESEDLAAVIHARTAGHPLLTVELLRGLASEVEGSSDRGDACRLAATLVPATASDAVSEWVAGLSPDARLALECAATLRNGFEEVELEAALGQAPGPALDELVEAGLLTRRGPGWTFRRTIVRDAIYARLGAAPRARRQVNLVARLAQGAAIRHPARLEQAGRWREASHAYLELAHHVLDRADADDAVWLFGRAADLAIRAADRDLVREAGDGRLTSLMRAGTTVARTHEHQTERGAEVRHPQTVRETQQSEPLSPRETQVVELVAAGHTNAEIAVHLSVSPKTVERHVSNVLAKLGFRSRVQVATAAVTGHLTPWAASPE